MSLPDTRTPAGWQPAPLPGLGWFQAALKTDDPDRIEWVCVLGVETSRGVRAHSLSFTGRLLVSRDLTVVDVTSRLMWWGDVWREQPKWAGELAHERLSPRNRL